MTKATRAFYGGLAFLLISTLHGHDEALGSDEWEIQVTPYFFAPAADLDATVAGSTVGIDMSFSDIWDEFDVFGLSLRTEAWKDEWGVIFDGMWTDLDGDFGPSDRIGVTIEEGMVDLLGGFRIKADSLNGQDLIIDVMPGLRYHYLKQQIKISLPIPIPTQGGSEDWIEPVIGARVAWPFAKRWTLMVRGDMGGFGIGAASDLAWSINGGIGFQFAEKWMLKLGYRYFDIDYSKGSGSKEFGIDGSLDGIWLGLTWAP